MKVETKEACEADNGQPWLLVRLKTRVGPCGGIHVCITTKLDSLESFLLEP